MFASPGRLVETKCYDPTEQSEQRWQRCFCEIGDAFSAKMETLGRATPIGTQRAAKSCEVWDYMWDPVKKISVSY